MIKPSEVAKPSADIIVGEMVEGLYCWNEYCAEHAAAVLRIYPDKRHRSVSVFEVVTSWRKFQCYACRKPLWNQPERRRADAPAASLPRALTDGKVIA